MREIFDIWGIDQVTGDRKPVKPSLCLFKNSIEACELLHKHLIRNQNIIIHCDVDVDGVGQGYIAKRFCEQNTRGQIRYCINKDKIHGIQEKHAIAFKSMPVGLLIIVDSSQNDIDTLKKFSCDVLVIDHHEAQENNTVGKTDDGHDYVIVNNVFNGESKSRVEKWLRELGVESKDKLEEYIPTDMMQCGLTIYELFRLYQLAYQTGNVIENQMLYQWSAVTLFTDQVSMLNDRNQWYVQNTICSDSIEPCLDTLMKELNPNQVVVDKQFIGFKLAPMINKAIRATAGVEAVNAILNDPRTVKNLTKYSDIQQRAMEIGKRNPVIGDCWVTKDIQKDGISKNYTGVIAASLSGEHGKPQAVYCIEDGKACGSFRGTQITFDYREFFERHRDGNFAQGHKAAFGFKVDVEELKSILNDLSRIEHIDSQNYLTAGSLADGLKGKHHIDSIEDFKRAGNLLRLAIGNSYVNSQEQIDIIVSIQDAKLIEQRGKLYIYDILGIKCKAFEQLQTDLIKVYAEQSNLINLYAKNYKNT